MAIREHAGAMPEQGQCQRVLEPRCKSTGEGSSVGAMVRVRHKCKQGGASIEMTVGT